MDACENPPTSPSKNTTKSHQATVGASHRHNGRARGRSAFSSRSAVALSCPVTEPGTGSTASWWLRSLLRRTPGAQCHSTSMLHRHPGSPLMKILQLFFMATKSKCLWPGRQDSSTPSQPYNQYVFPAFTLKPTFIAPGIMLNPLRVW